MYRILRLYAIYRHLTNRFLAELYRVGHTGGDGSVVFAFRGWGRGREKKS